MRYKLEKYKWWILCIITLAVFSILSILDYANPNECPENSRYILSAISQGLAAILALVFTITLVVAQMTRRYTAMDKIVFRDETISLMIVFGFGVVTPLLVLKFGWFCVGVSSSIAIAFFCVFSLIPFLKGVNDVLKYDIGIGNLDEEIMEAIEQGHEPKAKNKIRELNEIGRGAVKKFREDVARDIIHFLSKIGKKSAEKEFEDATFFVVEGLKNIGLEGAESGFEDETVLLAANGLKELRVKAAKNQWENITVLTTIFLRDIGIKAAEKGLRIATTLSVEGLKYVGTVGVTNDVTDETVCGLLCLGAAVQKYSPVQVDHVIKHLRKMVTEARSDNYFVIVFEKEYEKECISKYPHLESSFEEFIESFRSEEKELPVTFVTQILTSLLHRKL